MQLCTFYSYGAGMSTREIHIHIHLDGLAELVDGPVQVNGNTKKAGPKREPASSAEIRKWAQEVGMKVPRTGRPSRQLVAAYEAAHDLS